MKKLIPAFGLLLILSFSLEAQDISGVNLVINNRTTHNFAAGSLSDIELNQLIQAAIQTPSAANRQPWYFTVVRTPALARQLIPRDYQEGNVIFVISAEGDGRTNGVQILDCALAAQSINLAAQTLRLGSLILTGPIANVNTNHKAALGLPQGHNAIVIVQVGRKAAGVDATTRASSRKEGNAVVTYK